MDKATEQMQELVAIAGEATGVFSDFADEHLTVHIGGNTCEYAPRHERVDHRTDPVLKFVRDSDFLRIRRTTWSSRHNVDGEHIKTPAFTIEVME